MHYSLQAEFFLDKRQYDKERQFFEKTWIFVAHDSELLNYNVIARKVAGYPIIITKDHTETIRSFTNICRHRGSKLLDDGTGKKCRTISCPYHGWGYGLDGSLKQTPNFGYALNMGDYRLSEWHVQVINGLIFVSLDPKYTFEQQFGSCIDELHKKIPSYVVRSRKEFVVHCNWKLYVENYLEGYHIPFAHPTLAREIVMSNYEVRSHDGYISHHVTAKKGSVSEGYWMYLWPNVAINSYANGFSLERIIPISPTQTKISYLYLFSDNCSDVDMEKSMATSSKITEEDIQLVERIQDNLHSGLYIPGPLSPKHETGLVTFHSWLRNEGLIP